MTDYVYESKYQAGMTLKQMITNAVSAQGGPRPRCKQPVNVEVYQGEGVSVPLDNSTTRYAATNLFTCAAVIFTSEESNVAYLYHAASGIVSQLTFNAAMTALGNVSLGSVYVVYTFPQPTDQNYYDDASNIANYGVPVANIIYAPNLGDPVFGITSQGIVGS